MRLLHTFVRHVFVLVGKSETNLTRSYKLQASDKKLFDFQQQGNSSKFIINSGMDFLSVITNTTEGNYRLTHVTLKDFNKM